MQNSVTTAGGGNWVAGGLRGLLGVMGMLGSYTEDQFISQVFKYISEIENKLSLYLHVPYTYKATALCRIFFNLFWF